MSDKFIPPGFEKYPERINRAGKKDGTLSIKRRLRILLEIAAEEGRTNFDAVLMAQIAKALKGDTRAAEFIANRLEGLPKQVVENIDVPSITIIDASNASNSDIQGQPTEPEQDRN